MVRSNIGKTMISSISRTELKQIMDSAIKEWHFERCDGGRGVIPVKGKYDTTNPKHNIYPKKRIINPEKHYYVTRV